MTLRKKNKENHRSNVKRERAGSKTGRGRVDQERKLRKG